MDMRFKIMLIGCTGVGKSTFIRYHSTGNFNEKFIKTQGVDVIPLTFNTNYGAIIFEFWDCGGDNKFSGQKANNYTNSNGGIFMFDLNCNITSDKDIDLIEDVRAMCPNVPFAICGNKYDLMEKDRMNIKPVAERSNAQHLPNVKYYEISVMNNYNCEKPLQDLAIILTGHDDLKFI